MSTFMLLATRSFFQTRIDFKFNEKCLFLRSLASVNKRNQLSIIHASLRLTLQVAFTSN